MSDVNLRIDGKDYQLTEVDFNSPTICTDCMMPGVGNAEKGSAIQRIWHKANNGNYVCSCDNPTWINAKNPFLGWVPVDDVKTLLADQASKISECISIVTSNKK